MTDTRTAPPREMGEHYVRPEHLEQMHQIARVSSAAAGKRVWTELALYYRTGFNRPFVAVVEGLVGENERTDLIPRFKFLAAGTLDRAVGWFEGSELRDRLVEAVPADAAVRYANSNEQQTCKLRTIQEDWSCGIEIAPGVDIRADKIAIMPPGAPLVIRSVGITTTSLREALEWLYPDLPSIASLSHALERDFAMPARTTRRALSIEGGAAGEQGAWVGMFLASMKCFDRELWAAGQATIASVEG